MEHVSVGDMRRVEITAVHPHPLNARRGDMAAIERSIRQHGHYKPLVVQQGTNHILSGNHQYRVLRDKLGHSHVLAVFVTCTDTQARAILAVDNKASDSAQYDDHALLALLSAIEADGNLSASGFDDAELGTLMAAFDDAMPELMDDSDPLGPVEPDATPAPMADSSSAVHPDDSLADRAREYDQQVTRMLFLNYPVNHYTFLLEQLESIVRTSGERGIADVVLRLVAGATGAAIPDA